MSNKIKFLGIEMRFEQLLTILLLIIITIAMFTFGSDKEILYLIIGVLIGGFNSQISYFYTKHDPKENEEKSTD